jgi:hypothetical protein
MRGRAAARGVVSSKLVSRVLVVTLRRMSLASGDLNAKKRNISTRTKNLFFGFIVETSATLKVSSRSIEVSECRWVLNLVEGKAELIEVGRYVPENVGFLAGRQVRIAIRV